MMVDRLLDIDEPGRYTQAAVLPSHVKPGRWWAREHRMTVWHVEGERWSLGIGAASGEHMWRWRPLCGGGRRVCHGREWHEVGKAPSPACRRCVARLEKGE